jgi:hypothetical protein
MNLLKKQKCRSNKKENNMNTRKMVLGLMALGMMAISAFAVQAQRISPADVISIKSGIISVRSVPAPSRSIVADTTRSQPDVITDRKAIIGSWLETITFTGNVMPPTKSINTFNADGLLTVADQGAVTAATVFSPGHGAWSHISGRTFGWTILEMIYDPATGGLIGYLKVSGEYTTNAATNAYTGHFLATIMDPDNNVLATIDGTNEGTRIGVEPLP